MNINEAISSFFSDFYFPKESKNTKRLYITALKKFTCYLDETSSPVSGYTLDRLAPEIFPAYLAWLDQKGMAVHTIRIYEAALKRAVRFWRAKGWLTFTMADETEARQAMQIQRHTGPGLTGSPRVGRVPDDFGDRMVRTVERLALSADSSRFQRLGVLRDRALIHLLMATGLRIGDICRLTRTEYDQARLHNGYFTLKMEKTGAPAHCILGAPVLKAVENYLLERADSSPFLLIQHGRAGRSRGGSVVFFRTSRRGYGAGISTKTAWVLVRRIADLAYGKSDAFLSPHAFRHWHAQSLIRAGARLEDVQSVLGHSTPSITKQIYAPEPDLERIHEAERKIQQSKTA